MPDSFHPTDGAPYERYFECQWEALHLLTSLLHAHATQKIMAQLPQTHSRSPQEVTQQFPCTHSGSES